MLIRPIYCLKLEIIYLLLTLSFGQYTYAQTGVMPKIINYTSEVYKGGFQNKDIIQDENQILYVANSQGIAVFNGYYWQFYSIPNASSVRSLAISNEGTIYVGAQNEFGYLKKTSKGIIYQSLSSKILKENQQFNDIWNIIEHKNFIMFRDPNQIFLYEKNAGIKILKPEGTWSFLGKCKNNIYAQDSELGLLQYSDKGWIKICNNTAFNSSIITSIIDMDQDRFLITTQDEGAFWLSGNKTTPYISTHGKNTTLLKHIYAAKKLKNGSLLLGTLSHGVILMDTAGTIQKVFNKKSGLLSNNVRFVHEDADQNIWLALDYGISYIALNSPISYIVTDPEKEPTGYTSIYFNDRYWFGTSDGVYRSKPAKDQTRFQLEAISNTEGQVWNLQEVQGQLLMGHDKGLFNLTSGEAQKLYARFGTWLVLEQASLQSPALLAGTYNGILSLDGLQKLSNPVEHKIQGLNESIRFLLYDNYSNSYWASHPNRGIYQIFLSKDTKFLKQLILYNKNKGLPNDLHNYIYKIKNEIIAGTQDGLYLFSNMEKKFIPHPDYYKYTKGMSIQYIKRDAQDNIWMAIEEKIYVLRKNRSGFQLMNIPELNGKTVSGHVSLNVQHPSHVLIPANRGFIHLDFLNYKGKSPKVFLNKVISINQKDTLHSDYFTANAQLPEKLSYSRNALRFEFGAIEFSNQNEIEFSYQLEGFDDSFSTWSNIHTKDYTNLSPGNYTFVVKARFGNIEEASTITYHFRIKPPWYRSIWAYIIYILIFLFLARYFLLQQKRKYILKHERQKKMHKLELESSEKEIMRLKNEKLASEVEYKNSELSAMTIFILKRAEVLSKLKSYIKDSYKKTEPTKEILSTLLRIIRVAEKSQDEYDDFNKHFNEANKQFFENLKAQYPELTIHDLKLCALLKMGLSSKEISQIMNSSTKAVEIARYRLRKKLGLDSTVKIHLFFQSIQNQSED